MSDEKITQGLNPEQKIAVESLDGPLLILAGAGSGKTRVLTHRVANLILTGRAAPQEILAVTFTNKAAREMESRIFKILTSFEISVREPLWISTFHSVCTRILRSHIAMMDYKPFFSIYDDGDQLSLIKKIMTALKLNEKTGSAKAYRNKINWAKILAIPPEKAQKHPKLYLDQKSQEVYQLYEQEMKKANALDFGDLLLKTYDLFLMYPQVLESFQKQFKYILVDEYQDTNHIQYLLIKLLASAHNNICVVGDEDQSIYSWRGADISNILDFEKDFPQAKVIKLEENYRSTQNIIKGATHLISHNTQRKNKTLFSNKVAGDLIFLREETTEYDEARWVIKTIRDLVSSANCVYADVAIFYRTNAQSRVIEEQLRSNSIPYQIIGGIRFYERMEIKDILSYLRLSLNFADDMALKRIINVPTRGIGKTTVEKLDAISFEQKCSLYDAIKWAVDHREFNSGTVSKLRAFLVLIDELRDLSANNPLLDFFHMTLDKTEYLGRLRSESNPEADARIENIEELSNAISQFVKERPQANLQMFLEEMALVSDIDTMADSPQGVTLMTLHVSKGLEFPQVFVVGLEENLFPSFRANEDDDELSIEEERRLAYVGMTRAQDRLHLSYAKNRKVWGQDQFNPPSRFLKEIPTELISVSSALSTNRFVAQAREREHHTNYFPSSSRSSIQRDFESQSFPDYETSSSDDYQKGERVKHPTFGVGSIYQIEGSGESQKVSVLFQDQTIKKFVTKYARLEKL